MPNDKTELILLGAGASSEAGVPMSFAMSIRLSEQFDEDKPWLITKSYKEACPPEPFIYAFRFALGGLLARRGASGFDPLKGVDVEELFNTIEALSKREDLEISPFATWSDRIFEIEAFQPSVYDYVVKKFGKAGNDLASQINRLSKEQKNPKEFVDEIQNFQLDFDESFRDAVEVLSGVKRQHWVFDTTLEVMKRLLWRLVWIENKTKVEYLAPLVRYCEARDLTIASVNYDNAIELCGEANGFETKCIYHERGLPQFLAPGKGTVRLLKLHGSVDWCKTEFLQSQEKPAPQMSIIKETIKNPEEDFKFSPAVIFGQRNKLTADGPFLKLLSCFEEQLSKVTLLTVIGYSFRDHHINALICNWLNEGQDRTLRIVNGKSFNIEKIGFVTVENKAFLEKRITIIQELAGDGIKQLFSTN